jgi:hypothetical protein
VLGAGQRRPAPIADQRKQILGHLGHRPPGRSLPPGIGRRIDDDLAQHAPPRVMGFAAGDQEMGERLGDDHRLRLGSVNVEVAQCLGHAAATADRAGELIRRPPGS